jgi:type II secretory pathway predicted ATPase ExeA
VPFALDDISLLPQQQDVYDILKVHCQQGGLCALMGDAGTGKSAIKEAIKQQADKTMVVVTVARTLHTYTNTIKILCQAFNIEWDGTHFSCERRIIEQAYALNREGKTLVIIIDDAHLMEISTLRRIRLMLEDFPKNHNLILVGQPYLMAMLALKVNDDIKSRITFSTTMLKLNSDDMNDFILAQLDKAGLGHNTFNDDALALIIRSSDGILRRAKNLCLGCMLEAVRQQKKIITLDIVNKVLIQPHWRIEFDAESGNL